MNLTITGGSKSTNKTIAKQFDITDKGEQSFGLGLVFLYSNMLTVYTLQTGESRLQQSRSS